MNDGIDENSPDKELISDSLRQEIERSLSTLTGREADVPIAGQML